MTATVMIHVRMDSETKEQAKQALDEMGLSVSEAVRLFFHRIAREKALPFAVDVPNAETRAAMERARVMMDNKDYRPAADIENFFGELDARLQK